MAMFDKNKGTRQTPPREEEAAAARPAPSVSTSPAPAASSKVAMVGEGISITGDVSANSNLKVEGRIEGRSVASSQDVEVAESGVIKASISAQVIRIAGAVAGDITGSEKVVISKSGRVQGNIVAPRVQLDDGALFRGSIDMNPVEPAAVKSAPAEKPGQPVASATTAVSARKEPSLTLKSG